MALSVQEIDALAQLVARMPVTQAEFLWLQGVLQREQRLAQEAEKAKQQDRHANLD